MRGYFDRKRPFKYFVICNKTKDVLYETNQAPTIDRLQSYVEQEDGTYKLTQTKIAYIDTRYEAKLRLYKYITKKQGVLNESVY